MTAHARRRGPRPAGEDTRGAILAAARRSFEARGYDGTSLRAVARSAGVDPALVHHYFTGKEHLFAAAMRVPVDPAQVVADVASGGMDGAGERLVRTFLSIWDSPVRRPALVSALRAVVGSQATASMVRAFLVGPFIGELARRLGSPDPARSAALLGSQMVGIAVVRYVVRMEPVASATVDEMVAWYGPTLQRYLEHPGEPGLVVPPDQA